jgi:hypothetical protein
VAHESISSLASDLGRPVAQAKPLLLKLGSADTSVRSEFIRPLLSPQSERPTQFWLGSKQYDPVKAGYETSELEGME